MVFVSQPINQYKSDFFSLRLSSKADEVSLYMQFPEDCITTRSLPLTYDFLAKHIPSILQCQCFNDQGLPFSEELKKTELAHLFEHIVLDQLCQEKSWDFDAEYSGRTEWDWDKYPLGSFKVTIDRSTTDDRYFAVALNKSISLLEKLYSLHSKTIN